MSDQFTGVTQGHLRIEENTMKKSIIAAAFGGALASGLLMSAPAAHADPCNAQGLITAVAGSNGPSPICVRPGHIPPGYVDATGGNAWGGMNTGGPPPGFPCDSNDVHVDHVTAGGNAIEVWGPPGCNDMLPMSNN
jgi:hypothetical protein